MSQHHTQYGDLPLYIGGEACPSASGEWIEVTDPADQHLLARVPTCCGGRCRPPSGPGSCSTTSIC